MPPAPPILRQEHEWRRHGGPRLREVNPPSSELRRQASPDVNIHRHADVAARDLDSRCLWIQRRLPPHDLIRARVEGEEPHPIWEGSHEFITAARAALAAHTGEGEEPRNADGPEQA